MEDLRVDSYGGYIEHRDGPGGRRAGVVGGPDVWEVVTTEPGVSGRERRVAAVAEYLSLSVEQVAAAFRYYDDHRQEIDAWVAENDALSEESSQRP